MAQTPVIDLGPTLRNGSAAAHRAADELRAASEGLGFYFVGGHGVPQSLVDRLFGETKRFHALPLERKLSVRVTDKVVGYLPAGGQTQRTSKYGASRHPDTSASYYLRQEFPPDHPDRVAKKPWVFENRWIDGLPGFRETVLEYYEAMARLVRQLLRLQSMALGLGEDFLPSHAGFDPPLYNLRLIHYPPREQTLDGQFGIGPHTDYGYLTILAQGRVPGLEIMERDGSWIEAPALPGHFLVNNADLAGRWTNDRFRSAPHRVINKTGEARHSIAFFTAPRSDVLLECLPTCQGPENPARYPPITAGEYFAAINRRNYDVLASNPGKG